MTFPLAGTTLSENQQAALVYTLSDCFARRPTLENVAPGLVRDMLEAEYPLLGERLAHAALIQPLPSTDESSTVEYAILSLAPLLIERFLGEKARVHPAGSYLTLYPGAEYPQKLPLGMAAFETLLSEWAPLLLEAYKQELVDFWSLPLEQDVAPWQRLSELFAAQLRQACTALSGDELDTVLAVLDYPDLQARRAKFGNECAQAYIPIIDTRREDPDPLHVQALVISRKVGKRQIVLLYSLFGGIEAFDSSEALEASLGLTLSGQGSDFRNYSPDQHVFDALTVTLLVRQLEAIEAIKPGDYPDLAALEQRLHELTGLQALVGAFRSGHETKLGQLRNLLPGWLRNASPSVRTRYGGYVAALAAVHRRHAGKAFLDGIPDILAFARQALRASLEKAHSQAGPVLVSDISLTLTQGTNSSVELANKGFNPAGFRDGSQTRDYATLALKNLEAFPRTASVQVHYKGKTVPAWMTYEALRTAVNDADIGRTYPELLRQKLQHDRVERARQETLFTDYLRVLLPMLALELRLNQQLSEPACRYVEAAVMHDVGDQTVQEPRVVVRPLAFLAQPNAVADRVRNMFVIGPRATDQGPQVLCCPGSIAPLLEFSSFDGLLAAIKVEGLLQQSVLDGLDPTVRSIYDHGGFDEPHVGRVIVSDWEVPRVPGPVSLDITPLSGSFGAALFAASVEALIARAEADSVSNAEDRWNRFVDLGWALFGLLLPFLPSPLASMGLIVQLLSSLKTFADVLLNLAVVLVYHHQPLIGKVEAAASAARPRPIIDNAVIKAPAVSVARQLVFAWTRPGRHFSASELVRLEAFKLPLSEAPGSLLTSGEWQGLYQRDSLFYAQVDDAWFRVARKLDGVVIIDNRHPALQGPWLKSDGAGSWRLDRGLRLLGGVGELSVRAAKKLKSLEKRARDLLANVPALLADAERTASVVDSPLDIQNILELKAQPFEEAIKALRDLTQGLSQSPRSLISDLERAANTLADKGLSLRIRLTKERLPSAAAVRFLKEQEQITIRKLGERRDISQGKGSDFLEEYGISDRQNGSFWFAHFHYPTASTPTASYAKAHLKTREQRYLGLGFQIAQATAGAKVQPIWRGPIDAETAALFLSPRG
ncbi:dermonecrotic toxin domain-containing protein [Pseudomonas sp. FEN]|uniref:dermonecrotic toxin domain-containing protein n=1 Tax=Pseudomonas sp. FEN TaxID=2767468 RepID=UPI00174AF71C|nr:DUF6543 domain-containing protein [Pseudomonas sp. FEN]